MSYPGAGRYAQPEVKQAVQRFRRLPLVQQENEVLLYWLLGDGTPPYKMSQPDSDYVDMSTVPGQVCGNCDFAFRHVGTGELICSQIRDPIAMEGWCRLWAPVVP